MLTLATAVRVLQAHERARQGRVHAYFMRRMKTQTKTMEMKLTTEGDLDESCRVIQTIWRQKYAEKLFQRKKKDYAQMLGMVDEIYRIKSSHTDLDFTSTKSSNSIR